VLDLFCKTAPEGEADIQRNLEKYQATAKAFADIVSFTWEFDEMKVREPYL
jgi:ABC-type Zn uptake system ZnuABC Zn-binding protein ZnuA